MGLLESEEGDVEDNRIPSIASSRSNMSDHSVDAHSPHSPLTSAVSPAAMSGGGGGNPRISAPLQNTSLGSGKYLLIKHLLNMLLEC